MLSVLRFVSVSFTIRHFCRMVQRKYNALRWAHWPACSRTAKKNPSPLETDGILLMVAGIATGIIES